MLSYFDKLCSTHCRDFSYIKLCRPAYFVSYKLHKCFRSSVADGGPRHEMQQQPGSNTNPYNMQAMAGALPGRILNNGQNYIAGAGGIALKDIICITHH